MKKFIDGKYVDVKDIKDPEIIKAGAPKPPAKPENSSKKQGK